GSQIRTLELYTGPWNRMLTQSEREEGIVGVVVLLSCSFASRLHPFPAQGVIGAVDVSYRSAKSDLMYGHSEPEYLTLQEAARRASFHVDSLREWALSGRIGPAQEVFKVAGRWRVKWSKFQQSVLESGRFAE